MTPNDDARVRVIESKLAALERMLKPTGGLGQGVSTSYGSLNIRTTQLGFPAELTSTFNATTGYNWKRLALDTTGSITLTNPAIQLTGNRAYSIDGSTTLASGTKGWLEPSPESSGYLFTTASSSSAGFFARLTTSSGGNWNFYKLKLSSGAYIDDGSEVTGYNAVPLKIDGTDLCNPVAGLRVWMIPSQQSGKYEFLPIGMADGTHPGLISLTTQTMGDGDKTFRDTVTVNNDHAVASITPADRFYVVLDNSGVAASPGFRVRQYPAGYDTASKATVVGDVYIGGDVDELANVIGYSNYWAVRAYNNFSFHLPAAGADTGFDYIKFSRYTVGGSDYCSILMDSAAGSGEIVGGYNAYGGSSDVWITEGIGIAASAYAGVNIKAGCSGTGVYYCQGDMGLTEDVAIPAADGNTYTLHFTGGIYIGYTSAPTGT